MMRDSVRCAIKLLQLQYVGNLLGMEMTDVDALSATNPSSAMQRLVHMTEDMEPRLHLLNVLIDGSATHLEAPRNYVIGELRKVRWDVGE